MSIYRSFSQTPPDVREAEFNLELIYWARCYASRGFPVFPAAMIDGRKRPLVKIGRGKAHGSRASKDLAQIEAWWTRWPLAMIGMPTGAPSGIDVIDIDVKSGVNGFNTMRQQGWELPKDTVEVRTPSGGSHFYFRHNPELPQRSSAGLLGPGIDVRANGGMIILPPSRASLDAPDYHYAEGQFFESEVLQEALEAGRLTW